VTAASAARRTGAEPRLKRVDERLEFIAEWRLNDALARTPLEHHVIWSGVPAATRGPSLRGRAIGCIHEVGRPISLRVLLQRAARIRDGQGVDPDLARGAIRQHQSAKPAVLLLIEKRPTGEFVAVTDIPFPWGAHRPIRAGEVVVTGNGECLGGFLTGAPDLVA
jgi:hypothetical protein